MSHSFWKGKCNKVFSVHSSKTLSFWWIILWSCFEKYNKIWDFYLRIHWVSFPPNHGLFWNSLHTPIYSINIYIYLCVNTCVYMYIHIYVWALVLIIIWKNKQTTELNYWWFVLFPPRMRRLIQKNLQAACNQNWNHLPSHILYLSLR